MVKMKNRYTMVMAAFFFVLCIGVAFAEEKTEKCPTTGTIFDTLINKAYACHGEFLIAEDSISHVISTLKELFSTVLEKATEEKEMIMAMADTAFFSLISQDEVRQAFKSKITNDSKSTLDTLSGQLNASLEELNRTMGSATGIAKEIPEAIAKLPSEFKGLNVRKIPAVKSALGKTKGWIDAIINSVPISIEKINSTVNVINGLIN